MKPSTEHRPQLLDHLAPLLHQARTADERRLLLAATLAEHRRQGTPLFATPPTIRNGPAAGRVWGPGLSLQLLRTAAQGSHAATRQALQPLAQQHPWWLLGSAAAAGALLALTRPQRLLPWGWRWVRPVLGAELAAAVHGALRQGLRRGFVSAVRQGLAPSADRVAPGPDPS